VYGLRALSALACAIAALSRAAGETAPAD